MVFSKHLTYFTPNLGVINLGILDKKNKKPRMYYHGSYNSNSYTNLTNQIVNCKLSEPTIGYENILEHYAAYLQRLAATYPGCTVDSYDDNISGTSPN